MSPQTNFRRRILLTWLDGTGLLGNSLTFGWDLIESDESDHLIFSSNKTPIIEETTLKLKNRTI
jgi:hypothetical protein